MIEKLIHYPTIVIGSGFGGAVAASTLVDAGEQVLLLERGPWRDSEAVRGSQLPEVSGPTPRKYRGEGSRNIVTTQTICLNPFLEQGGGTDSIRSRPDLKAKISTIYIVSP